MTDLSALPGMLLVQMEPPSAMEDEFHAWYDTEHIPEREAVSGFLSAARFVCVEGWPRYMACYDLEKLSVLEEDAYRRIGGENLSVWSKRVLSRVIGYDRIVLSLAGGAEAFVAPANGKVMIRLAASDLDTARAAADALAADVPEGTVRAFRHGLPQGQWTLMVDAPALAIIPHWSPAELRAVLGGSAADLLGVWRYVRYHRWI